MRKMIAERGMLILIAIILSILVWGLVFPGSLPVWIGTSAVTNPSGEIVTPAKTLWDLLDLIIIPLALTWVVYWLNRIEKEKEDRHSEELNRREILKDYLDKMSTLILEKSLVQADRNAPVCGLARTLTKIALHELNGARRGVLMRFLHEAGLIECEQPAVFLAGADLREVQLDHARLPNAGLIQINAEQGNFMRAGLSGCDFRRANLSAANLEQADLRHAVLERANLIKANLSGANLENANLIRANLVGANLRGANLKNSRLQGVRSNPQTVWPDGFSLQQLTVEGSAEELDDPTEY